MALAVVLAVLVLLLHPATPGVKAPVESKQLKQLQSILLAVFCAVVFLVAVRLQQIVRPTQEVACERSPERTSFCSLLC
jgi:hypothetical protein